MQSFRLTQIGHFVFAGGSLGSFAASVLLSSMASGEVLQYGDGTADGKKSFGGSGQLIVFDCAKAGRWLNRIEMYGSRYGTETPPDEDFHLYVMDVNQRQMLRRVALPYSLWKRGQDYWRELPIPPIQVPQQLGIGLMFYAHQTKGVYVGTDKGTGSHSYTWTPTGDATSMGDVDWMVRITVEDAANGDPEARDLLLLRNGEAFFDRLVAAGGDPLALETARHGKLTNEEVLSFRQGAVTSPASATAVIVLANGMKIEGKVLAIDKTTLRIRDASGAERELPRTDVARIDFK